MKYVMTKTLNDRLFDAINEQDSNGSLVSYSFHQFFKSMNTESIKNKITKEAEQTISDITPSSKLS